MKISEIANRETTKKMAKGETNSSFQSWKTHHGPI